MQKLNTALTLIALLAVAYLLFDKFNSSEEIEESLEQEVVQEVSQSELPGEGKIAHINIDTINAKFTFLDDKLKVLQDEQSRSERRMQNKLRKAEEEFIKLQEDAKYMTPSQIQEAEQQIQQSQIDLQAYQERLGKELLQLESEIQRDLNDRIMRIVQEVNTKYGYDYILAKSNGGGILVGKQSYDLTDEVLSMLNDRYAEELAAEKSGK